MPNRKRLIPSVQHPKFRLYCYGVATDRPSVYCQNEALDCTVRLWLDTVEVARVTSSCSQFVISNLVAFVLDNRFDLLREWNEFFEV